MTLLIQLDENLLVLTIWPTFNLLSCNIHTCWEGRREGEGGRIRIQLT